QVIWDMRVFTQVYALQGMGAQTGPTNTIGVYIFRHGVAQGNYGTGSAIAVVLTSLMLVLSFAYLGSMIKEGRARPRTPRRQRLRHAGDDGGSTPAGRARGPGGGSSPGRSAPTA